MLTFCRSSGAARSSTSAESRLSSVSSFTGCQSTKRIRVQNYSSECDIASSALARVLDWTLSSCQFSCRAFAISGPQLWNSLPLDVRQSRDNLMQFKMKLKTFLFQQFWALLWIQSNEGPYKCSILLLLLLSLNRCLKLGRPKNANPYHHCLTSVTQHHIRHPSKHESDGCITKIIKVDSHSLMTLPFRDFSFSHH